MAAVHTLTGMRVERRPAFFTSPARFVSASLLPLISARLPTDFSISFYPLPSCSLPHDRFSLFTWPLGVASAAQPLSHHDIKIGNSYLFFIFYGMEYFSIYSKLFIHFTWIYVKYYHNFHFMLILIHCYSIKICLSHYQTPHMTCL